MDEKSQLDGCSYRGRTSSTSEDKPLGGVRVRSAIRNPRGGSGHCPGGQGAVREETVGPSSR